MSTPSVYVGYKASTGTFTDGVYSTIAAFNADGSFAEIFFESFTAFPRPGSVVQIVVTPAGDVIFSLDYGNDGNQLFVYNAEGDEVATFNVADGQSQGISVGAISGDIYIVAADLSPDGSVVERYTRSGSLVASYNVDDTNRLTNIAVDETSATEGRLYYATGGDHYIGQFDLATNTKLSVLYDHGANVGDNFATYRQIQLWADGTIRVAGENGTVADEFYFYTIINADGTISALVSVPDLTSFPSDTDVGGGLWEYGDVYWYMDDNNEVVLVASADPSTSLAVVENPTAFPVEHVGFNQFDLNAIFPFVPVTPTPDLDGDAEDVEIRWLRRTPHVSSGGNRLFFGKLQLDMQVGVGSEVTPDPVVMLRTSNDGGQTWSSIRTAPMGKIGKYLTRVQWYRNGSARDRVFEISGTGDVMTAIMQAWIEADEGTH